MLAVISDGATVTEVAARFGVARKTVHDWLAKYEAGGLESLGDRSHRPRSCPHQIGSDVEVAIARMRTSHPWWGPRRIAFELAKAGLEPVPSESAVYRALLRLGLIDPAGRRRRDRKWKRWERGEPMELWQLDVVGVEVLFDRVCRENGIEHLLTQPRSPTTTGKVERFHRALLAGAPAARIRQRLKQASITFDSVFMEDGVLQVAAGPNGSMIMPVPVEESENFQTARQRSEAQRAGFVLSVGEEIVPGSAGGPRPGRGVGAAELDADPGLDP